MQGSGSQRLKKWLICRGRSHLGLICDLSSKVWKEYWLELIYRGTKKKLKVREFPVQFQKESNAM